MCRLRKCERMAGSGAITSILRAKPAFFPSRHRQIDATSLPCLYFLGFCIPYTVDFSCRPHLARSCYTAVPPVAWRPR